MIDVNFFTSVPDQKFTRQTPGGKGIWGQFRFLENNYDLNGGIQVVFHDLQMPFPTNNSHSNSVLITAEPPSLCTYPEEYLSQFGNILTPRKDISHPGRFLSQQLLPWHIGLEKEDKLLHVISRTRMIFDDFLHQEIPKSKVLSIITSAKRNTPGHIKRLEFAYRLKDELGDSCDLFGAGINHIGDKWKAIAPYKYHVAIENSTLKNYWTEKISDCYLGESFPIYYGCPNIGRYFPNRSYATIDITDNKKAVSDIRRIVDSGYYERYRERILKAKFLVLYNYNIFPSLVKFFKKKKLPGSSTHSGSLRTIYPMEHFRNTK